MPDLCHKIEGIRLCLRLVEPNDAAYIFSLRTNPVYNTYLSAVNGTVEDQRMWIERYKEREAAGHEYYFVIERRDEHIPCGLVRLYDIDRERLTWGSWILDANKPRKAALESANLSFGVAFNELSVSEVLVKVNRDNLRAISFYQRYGMTLTNSGKDEFLYIYSVIQYFSSVAEHWRL